MMTAAAAAAAAAAFYPYLNFGEGTNGTGEGGGGAATNYTTAAAGQGYGVQYPHHLFQYSAVAAAMNSTGGPCRSSALWRCLRTLRLPPPILCYNSHNWFPSFFSYSGTPTEF
ncbi:unnamed protein product [Camellia sinensis]